MINMFIRLESGEQLDVVRNKRLFKMEEYARLLSWYCREHQDIFHLNFFRDDELLELLEAAK